MCLAKPILPLGRLINGGPLILGLAGTGSAAPPQSTPTGSREDPPAPVPAWKIGSQEERLRRLEQEVEELRTEAPFKPGKAEEEGAQPAPVRIGGALRFNYGLNDFDERVQDRRRGRWIRALPPQCGRLQGGLSDIARVPLAALPGRPSPRLGRLRLQGGGPDPGRGEQGSFRASAPRHPQLLVRYPYYVGLGDQYDLGAKYLRKPGAWDLQLEAGRQVLDPAGPPGADGRTIAFGGQASQ